MLDQLVNFLLKLSQFHPLRKIPVKGTLREYLPANVSVGSKNNLISVHFQEEMIFHIDYHQDIANCWIVGGLRNSFKFTHLNTFIDIPTWTSLRNINTIHLNVKILCHSRPFIINAHIINELYYQKS